MALKELPELLSAEEMRKHKIPLGYRDRCAKLLVPLNICRKESYYMPYACVQERHDYEECQYLDFLRRMDELKELKAKKLEEAA